MPWHVFRHCWLLLCAVALLPVEAGAYVQERAKLLYHDHRDAQSVPAPSSVAGADTRLEPHQSFTVVTCLAKVRICEAGLSTANSGFVFTAYALNAYQNRLKLRRQILAQTQLVRLVNKSHNRLGGWKTSNALYVALNSHFTSSFLS